MAARKRFKRGDHLLLRGNVWFYRRGVPEALQARLGREIVRTLRSGDVVEARRRSRVLNAEVERVFTAAREGVVKGAGKEVDADTTERLLTKICAQFTHDSLLDDRRARRELDDVEAGDWNVDRGQIQELYAERFEAGALPTTEAVETLKRQGVELTPAQFEALVREMRHALISTRGLVEKERDADIRGEPRVELPTVALQNGNAQEVAAVPSPKPSPPLTKVMEKYKSEKTSTGVWSERVAHDSGTLLDRFVECIGGDREVGSVTRDEIREWRDEGLKGQAQATVRHRVKLVASFFAWCVAEEHIEKNPSKRLAPPPPSKRSGKTRRAYTSEDLKLLLGPELTAKRGKRDDHFWIPIIALYTGARVSEIAQLAVEDVVKKKGVVCFEIRPEREEQRVKSEASERPVPVHSHLLKLGLGEHVKARKAAGETWLFPNVALGTRGRGMGARITGWWPRWVKNFEGISERTTFHSLRHNFLQALIAASVPEVEAKQLGGHADPSMTTGVYGKRLDVRQLADAIEKLDFSNEVDAIQSLSKS